MNVTFNTNRFTSQNYLRNNKKSSQQPSFNGATDFILKHYTAPLYSSCVSKFLVKNTEKLNSIVDHMQVLGSIIVTGMYMGLTLRNEDLDPQKKKTLAVNQFLTFLASTILSYTIDKKLDDKWEDLTRRYTLKKLPEDKKETLESLNKKIANWNIENEKLFNQKIASGELDPHLKFKPNVVADYAEKVLKDPELANLLKGMGILKKLLVFGTIYRFISPVAVTPIANWIGNEFIYKNQDVKQKQA
ncbi:hypothetical protein J6G99_05745 [bacterium]|nr:hypothetical protein [bacterium]